jgi:hypothetical protein
MSELSNGYKSRDSVMKEAKICLLQLTFCSEFLFLQSLYVKYSRGSVVR